MNESSPTAVASIDVGKSKLDVHLLDGGVDRVFRNNKCGRRALRNWLLRHGVTRAVFEPTGRYHRKLHQCLAAAGIETVLVNPLRSRRFAEALGRLAKNDRVDAGMLARFGLRDVLAAPCDQPAEACRGVVELRSRAVREPVGVQAGLRHVDADGMMKGHFSFSFACHASLDSSRIHPGRRKGGGDPTSVRRNIAELQAVLPSPGPGLRSPGPDP